ncbi:MAG: nucleoid-structuring protein H-NS [Bacteroidetes bacterium]|nr:nucleoid-structuring protein H-NS [Bacteroidota bacterium]MDA1268457.1 nucleoid-structuring protein H-NS [Bacteroidota bacterium]
MKHQMFALSLRKTMLMAVLVLLAMGACKSKKKAVEPAPAPVVQEEVAKPAPAPVPVARSAEEIAVEKLETQFTFIASASNVTTVNQSIQEVLAMFSNQETPILIVIHEEGGVKDYDEPTTIKKYLEYLKDTKKNLNYISDIRMAGGKVTELELKRK